jgi:hypothetical protein
MTRLQRQFLVFTALTLPACLLLILWLDKPLALFFHHYTAWAVPFFEAFTAAVDSAYAATLHNWLGWPALFWGVGVAYVLGRWVLR